MSTDTCERQFDESLLSGYVDGMLTQADRQRVEVHTASCSSCRRFVTEIRNVRAATRSTTFTVPPDDQWRETPRSPVSAVTRSTGWILLVVWVIASSAFGVYELAISAEPLWEKVLVFSGLTAVGLLLLSALLDRLVDLETDPYRRVEK